MCSKVHQIFVYLCALLILFCAYISYAHNAFMVVSDTWFRTHQIDSEQLVLDGMLNNNSNKGAAVLGRFSRPDIEMSKRTLDARELYANRDRSGIFIPYKSQFGLQLKAFNLLDNFGVQSIKVFYTITAFLMSLIVVGMFFVVWRDFSLGCAVFFTVVFVFSPWIVVFARNLYWVMFLWYLPMLLTMWLSPRAFCKSRALFWMMALLFGAYILKFLCGYEYLTSIFVASCAPIAYHGIRIGCKFRKILLMIFLNVVVLLSAFAFSLTIHAGSLSDEDQYDFSHIAMIAKKRTISEEPLEIAKRACGGNTECEEKIAASLQSNVIIVASKYFIFRDFLPWLNLLKIDNKHKPILKNLFENFNKKLLLVFLNTLKPFDMLNVILFVLFQLLSIFAFVSLILVTIIFFNKFSIETRYMLAIGFVAPLSWYFAAKGHSYIHYHMNYVLWYLPFVPISVIALASLCAENNKSGKL